MSAGIYLKAWRERAGKTDRQAAAEVGVSRSAWRRYESDERYPKWPVLDRIVVMAAGEIDANMWLGKEAADVVARRSSA